MNVARSDLWYFILPILICVVGYFIYLNNLFTKWIYTNWFMRPNYFYILSSIFYFLFLFLIFFSLFDIRGNEERVSTNIPDQKTILLLDVSSSMLAEDLRPNRFKKALMLARHFVKISAGHQISLVLFSDFQKRVVPFTDDVDLLEARIAGFEDLDIRSGSSNLTQALNESVKYFYEEGNKNEVVGNILVFTDSEEQDEGAVIDIPDNITVAIVGVGTVRGGTIPLRDRTGIYRGNKTYKGEDVVSKLNEEKLRSFSSKIKNYKYWVASTYSLPTEDVQQFFRSKFKEKMSKGEVFIRPVMAHRMIIPAIICLILYFIFSRARQFQSLSVLIFILYFTTLQASDFKNLSKEDGQVAKRIEQKLIEGRISKNEKIKLAELFLKNKESDKSEKLYRESAINIKKDSDEDLINYATSLITAGKKKEALELYSEVLKKIKSKKEINQSDIINLNAIRSNSLQSVKSQKEEKKDNEKKENDQKDNEKQNNEQKDKNKSDSKDQKDDQKSKTNKKDKEQEGDEKDKQKNESDKQKEDKKDQKKNEKDKEKSDQEKNVEQEKKNEQNIEDKEDKIKQQRKMVKVPALLRQLMNNDRNLQKKMFDTTTQQGKPYDKKDW